MLGTYGRTHACYSIETKRNWWRRLREKTKRLSEEMRLQRILAKDPDKTVGALERPDEASTKTRK